MPHYGKYRGIVIDNQDPEALARLQVQAPTVAGSDVLHWALPCLPPGVPPVLPDIGDTVWIEFEGGDIDMPLWCGVFWTGRSRQLPTPADGSHPETWSIRTSDGATIEIGPAGIVLDNGKGARITLQGPAVSINRGALEIV